MTRFSSEQGPFAKGTLHSQERISLDDERPLASRAAYTIKHSKYLRTYNDGDVHIIKTGAKTWRRMARLLDDLGPELRIPVLFAPAEDFSFVVGWAELASVKIRERGGGNSFSFRNFRFLDQPLSKPSIRLHDGRLLGAFRRDYAVCRTPRGLAQLAVKPHDMVARDIAKIRRDPSVSEETERETLVQARLGQGKFRLALDRLWGGTCAVTGCSIRELLRASHIKPWRASDNQERLDANNGILLSANIDILFDCGLVSFDDTGAMMVSSKISAADRRLLRLPGRLLRRLNNGQRRYLAHHRKSHGFT